MRYVAMHIRVLLLVILAGCTGSGLLGYGQGTSASLTGNVTDSSGAVVSGATVTVTNVDTNFTQIAKTDSVGNYLLRPLPIGNYSLRIEAAGFDRYLQNGIVLTANLAATQDVRLKAGRGQSGNGLGHGRCRVDQHLFGGAGHDGRGGRYRGAAAEWPRPVVAGTAGARHLQCHAAWRRGHSDRLLVLDRDRRLFQRRTPGQHLLYARRRLQYGQLHRPDRAISEFRCDAGVQGHHQQFQRHYGFSPGAVVSIATKSGINQRSTAAHSGLCATTI